MTDWRCNSRVVALAVVLVLVGGSSLHAQVPPSAAPPADAQLNPSLETLAAEIRQLQRALEQLRADLTDSRRETTAVQQALQALRDEVAEERDLQAGQLGDLEQTKVDSGSKYHTRLSGMALMNVVGTRGAVDNLDVPTMATSAAPGDSGGSVSATVRQSTVGLAVFGPTLHGAATSANVTFDFFGGFPAAGDGLSSALLRLRTAELKAEWTHASIEAGQTVPFFSPLSPTSLASSAYPALASAGNLWVWTPQIHVDRRLALSKATTITVQAGILDSLTGELPASEYLRMPTAGERARTPAEAARVGWRRLAGDRVFEVGGGGYYARQNWGFNRTVHAWTATGDWDLPLSGTVTLSGEIYHGRAIGGLGGGAHASVLFDGSPTSPTAGVFPLVSSGGWTQLKVKTTRRLELNGAFGQDRSRPGVTGRLLAGPNGDVGTAGRNGSAFLNSIYQARSNIILSIEYRRLWTTGLNEPTRTADHVSVSSGIAF